MAVNEYTYGTVVGVQGKISWAVPGRLPFGSDTTPTITEVESSLDNVASDIHAKLAEAGYPVITKAAVTAAAPRLVGWLQRLNEAGACADILQNFAIANDPESGYSPDRYWSAVYKNGLKMISGPFPQRLGLAKTNNLSDMLVATGIKDSDGVLKEPMFSHEMFGSEEEEEDDA
jgi:hypothetical protein